VRCETEKGETLFMGDGINDAPSLAAATIGIAFGHASEITSEAADAVILDSSLERVDELLHISRRMRRIALQSAVGGMALSMIGMGFAAFGYLTPVAGAFLQETIDVLAVLNALRAASPPKHLSDLHLAKANQLQDREDPQLIRRSTFPLTSDCPTCHRTEQKSWDERYSSLATNKGVEVGTMVSTCRLSLCGTPRFRLTSESMHRC
jgi:hypothetical protein